MPSAIATTAGRRRCISGGYCTKQQLASFLLLTAAVLCGAAATFGAAANITWEAERLLEFKQGLSQVEPLSGWRPSNLAAVCGGAWKGVVCSASGDTVTGLNFTDFNVSGRLTSPLCQLPNLAELRLRSNWLNQSFPGFLLESCRELRVIDFSLNSFYGLLPTNLSSSVLSKLEEFNMEGNNFEGDIPADLGRLSELRLLRLRGNLLSGRIPGELSQLSRLTILDVAYNPFLPQAIPPELANLSSLQQWDFPGCGLIGGIPDWLSNLTHLWFLNLEYNNLSGSIPPSLAKLPNLTEIYLDRNNLFGPLPSFSSSHLRIIQFQLNSLYGSIPRSFASLSSLVTLNLDYNNLTGSLPDGLASLPQLQVFAVSDNDLSGTLSPEWGLHSQLFQFDVSDNRFFHGPFPPHLCNGSALAYLALKNNRINGTIPEEYGHCKSLLRFVVDGNELSGSVPSGLWTLPNIQVIYLTGNSLSGRILFNYADASAKYGSLQTVFIDSNRFEGPIPEDVDKFWFNLTKLTATQNNLSGPLPARIGFLTELEVLNLSRNAISGEIPPSIGGCESLNSLSLSQNDISGPIPAELGRIPNLNYLDLSKNHLNGSIPEAIANSTYNIFDVSDNDLSGIVPEPLSVFGPSAFEGNPKLCISAKSCTATSTGGSDGGKARVKLVVTLAVLGACVVVLCVALSVKMYTKGSRSKVQDPAEDEWTMIAFERLGFDEGEIYKGLDEGNVIGWGGSGKVYKVSTKEVGQVVAVKKLVMPTMGSSRDRQKQQGSHTYGGVYVNRRDERSAFTAEVETLGKIRHKNIVRLKCWCACKEAKLLVYEYMSNGSLADVLHKSFRRELLSWGTRFHIALDAAEGLAYLHHACLPPILHRDVKSSNILLDAAFHAKLADFGVAKWFTGARRQRRGTKATASDTSGVVGSVGYIAPEYAYNAKVDEKSDVYSYGVVLLELLTGRSPTSKDMECERLDLVKWVGQMVTQSKEEFWKILDCRLEVVDSDRESVTNVLKLALLCTCTLPRQRPSMREVVEVLHRAMPTSMCLSHEHEDAYSNKKHIAVSIVN